jgi:hypothetical protein
MVRAALESAGTPAKIAAADGKTIWHLKGATTPDPQMKNRKINPNICNESKTATAYPRLKADTYGRI